MNDPDVEGTAGTEGVQERFRGAAADTGLVERLKKAEYWQEHYRNSAEMLRMDLAAAREQIEELKATINQMYVDVQAARDAAFTPEVTDGQ